MSDRVGLLAEVTGVIATNGMTITSGVVSTRMGKAVNEFYVVAAKSWHKGVDFNTIENVRRIVGPSVLMVRNAPKELLPAPKAEPKPQDQLWNSLGDAFMNILGFKK